MKKTTQKISYVLLSFSLAISALGCSSKKDDSIQNFDSSNSTVQLEINHSDFQYAASFKVTNAVAIRGEIDNNVNHIEYLVLNFSNYALTFGEKQVAKPTESGKYVLKVAFEGKEVPMSSPIELIKPGEYKFANGVDALPGEIRCDISILSNTDEKNLFGFPIESEGTILIKENTRELVSGVVNLKDVDGNSIHLEFSTKVGSDTTK